MTRGLGGLRQYAQNMFPLTSAMGSDDVMLSKWQSSWMCHLRVLSICPKWLANSIILQMECTNLNDGIYVTFLNCLKIAHTTLRMCHFETIPRISPSNWYTLFTDRPLWQACSDKWKALLDFLILWKPQKANQNQPKSYRNEKKNTKMIQKHEINCNKINSCTLKTEIV